MTNHNCDTPIRIQRQGSGWVAEGPDFYVWDENPNEVVRAAREVLRGDYSVSPTRRTLVVQPQEVRIASSSAEALDF